MKQKWIGVDLDKTLVYDHNPGAFTPGVIGEPIPSRIAMVKHFLAQGRTVKIFTARVWYPRLMDTTPVLYSAQECRARFHQARAERNHIKLWSQEIFGQELEATCEKDPDMDFCIDDRAYHVAANGDFVTPELSEIFTQP